MAILSSQSIRSESEMVSELRPIMPVDLFMAAIEGNRDVLIPRVGLQPEEPMQIDQVLTEEKDFAKTSILNRPRLLNALSYPMVTREASHSASEEISTENKTVQSELQSATHFGDTILHLLVTEGHNELALMVFQRDMSLLKAQNNIFETPLYCAAKVGNEGVIHNLIQSDPVIVKDALTKTNKNGDTALHVASKHCHIGIGCKLMNLDPKLAYKVNDKMEYPLYMAIIEGSTKMVQRMLEVDPTLACTPFSDGMFPVHEAARMGNLNLVNHFLEKYPDGARLRDPRGRNIFHIAAEENQKEIFTDLFKDASFTEIIKRMNTATNYEGDTPLVIAAMKGHNTIMKAIWEHYQVAETIPNKNGYRPLQLSAKEVAKTNKDIDDDVIDKYLKTHEDYKFTRKWFDDVMKPPFGNKWERTQVIGLGSVLITTIAFAAAFTIPGGYNQDHGTPVMGRRYMFRAFILANALAFIEGFLSLLVLLGNANEDVSNNAIGFATILFVFAASSMVVAFGLGMYVTLAPVWYPIAVLILVITLILGSPAGVLIVYRGTESLGPIINSNSDKDVKYILAFYVITFLFIFCLAIV